MLQTPKRRNKAYGGASIVYPGMLIFSTGDSTLASATDGVMTRFEPSSNWDPYWPGYLFHTSGAAVGAAYLEINIGPSTIRTMLLSTREMTLSVNKDWSSKGLRISVGDTLASSTPCFTCLSGYSNWFTCNNLAGKKLFVNNPTIASGFVMLYEIMAYEQINLLLNGWII